jgi:hypothetical protein
MWELIFFIKLIATFCCSPSDDFHAGWHQATGARDTLRRLANWGWGAPNTKNCCQQQVAATGRRRRATLWLGRPCSGRRRRRQPLSDDRVGHERKRKPIMSSRRA